MKKIALKITIVFMLILAMCMGYVQATIGSDYNFGITAYRTDSSNNKYVYTFYPTDNKSGLKYIWNVQQYSNGIAKTDEVFYCLSQGYGDFGDFTSEARPEEKPNVVGGISPSAYSGPYRLKDTNVKNTLQALYSGTEVVAFNDDIYSGLLWILDNMYISGQDDKTEFLSKIQCTEDVEVPGMSSYTVAQAMAAIKGTDDDLSEFDIEIAQQLAIWSLTNNETVSSFPSIYLAINDGTLKTYSNTYTGKDATKNNYNYGELRNFYVKMVYNYLVNGANSAIQSGYKGDNITTISVYANTSAQPVVSITREKEITGEYDVIVKKVDTQGNILSGAVFTVNGNNYTTGTDGTVTVADNIAITEENVGISDKYSIVETSAPNGYNKYAGTINLTVTKKESDDGLNYIIDTATLDSTSSASGHVTLNKDTNTITITVVDDPIEGQYTVKINKQNKEGIVLQGAVFTVNNKTYTTNANGNATIASNVEINVNNVTAKDTYKITETTAPEGYLVYDKEITLEVTKKLEGTQYVLDTATLDSTSSASGHVTLNKDTNTITITVVDDPIEGQYTVKINKQNKEGIVLQGAVFTVNDKTYTTNANGNATIASNVEINVNNVTAKDTYKITETTAPEGYLAYDKEITLEVTKKLEGTQYVLDTATLDSTSSASGHVTLNKDTNTITITVVDDPIEGQYTVKINKQNQKGEVLQGAIFTVNNTTYTTDASGNAIIASNVEINEENVSIKDTYKITEMTAPDGYVVYDGEIVLEVTKKQDGEIYTLDTAEIDETSKASNKVKIEINDKTNTITVIVIEDNIDLSLRKFISKVVDSEGNDVYTDTDLTGRVPDVKTDNLKDKSKDITTAKYIHTKQPVRVSVGDKVTYTIRVYNEGESDAYITEITDYLSTCLEYVENNEWYREYGQSEDNYASKAKTSTLTTITGASKNLQDKVGAAIGEGILLPAYDNENDLISYIDVQITCEVLEPELANTDLIDYEITNIAEITGMLDRNKNKIDKDIDSTKINVELPKTEEDWVNYKNEDIGKKDYIPGQEDDDDFEKVVIVLPKYDLALRKFITAVDGTELTNTREPKIDTTTLKQGIKEIGYGTARYIHLKEPVKVKRGNVVTYTIRVYNEGNVDAYVSEIRDILPEYLEFLKDDELNKKYGWIYDENTGEVRTTITARDNEGTSIYANRANGKMLLAYAGGDTLDYIDVKINCKVSDKAIADINQTNIAEITGITASNGDKVKDEDSVPNENLVIPDKENLPSYKDNEDDNGYVPGQEDDDDFDKVLVQGDFDLALRKFITKVNSTDVKTRYPEVTINDNGKIKYTHTKNPVKVCYQDTVVYTIRVYNEGEVDGYANEITDDVPDGLEFIVDNEINKTYRWIMLDENQEVTEDVSKAKYLVTDYLSEEQGKETGRDNEIKAFDKNTGITETNPDYRDVQIAFKVNYTVTSPEEESRVLVNVAQISEDSNDDVDSQPSRTEEYDEDPEDDIDYENVIVKYFDLSLLKWVTQAIIVENGETSIIETGHTGLENPEPVVKVEIKSKDVNKVIVKFAYKIKITNEGEIAGYANEITDYIPEGLKFVAEDNPGWYERTEGVVATDLLKDTLLQPGESAEVEIILTWINGEKNLGTKINVAEISKDDNESDTPDIDSTPDNEAPEEDDIDDAPVMLVIKTGINTNVQYVTLGLMVMTILTSGIIAIKKFVLI